LYTKKYYYLKLFESGNSSWKNINNFTLENIYKKLANDTNMEIKQKFSGLDSNAITKVLDRATNNYNNTVNNLLREGQNLQTKKIIGAQSSPNAKTSLRKVEQITNQIEKDLLKINIFNKNNLNSSEKLISAAKNSPNSSKISLNKLHKELNQFINAAGLSLAPTVRVSNNKVVFKNSNFKINSKKNNMKTFGNKDFINTEINFNIQSETKKDSYKFKSVYNVNPANFIVNKKSDLSKFIYRMSYGLQSADSIFFNKIFASIFLDLGVSSTGKRPLVFIDVEEKNNKLVTEAFFLNKYYENFATQSSVIPYAKSSLNIQDGNSYKLRKFKDLKVAIHIPNINY
jgi:hypothetical protein